MVAQWVIDEIGAPPPQPRTENPLHDDDPSNDHEFAEWKKMAEAWRAWARAEEDLVSKGLEKGYDLEKDLGYKNEKDEGMSMHARFGAGGLYSREGAAVDPRFQYDWGRGMKIDRATADKNVQWVPINANEKYEHERAQQNTAAGLTTYGQQSMANNFGRAVSAGHFTFDPKSGNYYNVGTGNPQDPRTWQWVSDKGQPISGPDRRTGRPGLAQTASRGYNPANYELANMPATSFTKAWAGGKPPAGALPPGVVPTGGGQDTAPGGVPAVSWNPQTQVAPDPNAGRSTGNEQVYNTGGGGEYIPGVSMYSGKSNYEGGNRNLDGSVKEGWTGKVGYEPTPGAPTESPAMNWTPPPANPTPWTPPSIPTPAPPNLSGGGGGGGGVMPGGGGGGSSSGGGSTTSADIFGGDRQVQDFGMQRSLESYYNQMAKRDYLDNLAGSVLGLTPQDVFSGTTPPTPPTTGQLPPGLAGVLGSPDPQAPPSGGPAPGQLQQDVSQSMFLAPQMEQLGRTMTEGIERLKREGRHKDIPAFVESMQGQKNSLIQGLQGQMLSYLQNPDPYAELPSYMGDIQASTQWGVAGMDDATKRMLGFADMDLRRYLGDQNFNLGQADLNLRGQLGFGGLDLQRQLGLGDLDLKRLGLGQDWNIANMGNQTQRRGQDMNFNLGRMQINANKPDKPTWYQTIGNYIGQNASQGAQAMAMMSDLATKTDVEPYTEGLEALRMMEPISFTYIDEKYGDTKKTTRGVIAQEVEKVLPEAVERVPELDNLRRVDYAHILMTNVNATKEIADELDAIKERLASSYRPRKKRKGH